MAAAGDAGNQIMVSTVREFAAKHMFQLMFHYLANTCERLEIW